MQETQKSDYLVRPIEASDDARSPGDYAARYGATTLPFDYVWFTPRASDEDRCAAMRAR